ncbi:MAG: histidinol dehydrogenase [Candidatus Diapherotrites archaeon]
MVPIIRIRNESDLKNLFGSGANLGKAESKAREIVETVRKNGDKALIAFTKKFDGVDLAGKGLRVKEKEFAEAMARVSRKEVSMIKRAAKNIEKFHKQQMVKGWKIEIERGITAGQLVKPIESAGVYVPGGRFPLASSLLMGVIPAKVAGVKEIIVCTPPQKDGKVNAIILAAARVLGIKKVFKAGGAQAIAAMAYGTKTIPKVNKIVGPGNVFVTAAKKLVYGDVGIDFIAGPSEVGILAGGKANAAFIAADMLAQAEHDELAKSILVTDSRELAVKVKREIGKQIKGLKTRETAAKSLARNGKIFLVKNMNEGVKAINAIAPEHLVFLAEKKYLKSVENAGSIFIGAYSPVSAGDYASGTNHVLPTGGFAKARGGLSVLDFLKLQSFQELSKKGLERIGKTVEGLAELEGLDAHSKAVKKRLGE